MSTRTQPATPDPDTTHTHHQTRDHEPDTTSDDEDDLSKRERKALTNAMLVLPDQFRAKNAPGLYEVFTTGDPYLVDLYQEVCECPDHRYRETTCKHIHRVKYAIGEKPVPDHVDLDPDPLLGTLTTK